MMDVYVFQSLYKKITAFHYETVYLCSIEEMKSYASRLAWRWVNYTRKCNTEIITFSYFAFAWKCVIGIHCQSHNPLWKPVTQLHAMNKKQQLAPCRRTRTCASRNCCTLSNHQDLFLGACGALKTFIVVMHPYTPRSYAGMHYSSMACFDVKGLQMV